MALAAALEQVRIIEGVHTHANNHDERLSGWFLQRTPTIGTPISLRLVKRDPNSHQIMQVVQVCEGAEHNSIHSPGRKNLDRQRPPHND